MCWLTLFRPIIWEVPIKTIYQSYIRITYRWRLDHYWGDNQPSSWFSSLITSLHEVVPFLYIVYFMHPDWIVAASHNYVFVLNKCRGGDILVVKVIVDFAFNKIPITIEHCIISTCYIHWSYDLRYYNSTICWLHHSCSYEFGQLLFGNFKCRGQCFVQLWGGLLVVMLNALNCFVMASLVKLFQISFQNFGGLCF